MESGKSSCIEIVGLDITRQRRQVIDDVRIKFVWFFFSSPSLILPWITLLWWDFWSTQAHTHATLRLFWGRYEIFSPFRQNEDGDQRRKQNNTEMLTCLICKWAETERANKKKYEWMNENTISERITIAWVDFSRLRLHFTHNKHTRFWFFFYFFDSLRPATNRRLYSFQKLSHRLVC